MEYAIGKILFISGTIARIKVLCYPSHGFWTSANIETTFPSQGKVFAPNLPGDYPLLKPDDVICFSYIVNPKDSSREDDDLYIIPRKKEGGNIWKCPVVAKDITEDDIFHRKAYSKDKDLIFFTSKQGSKHYICGPIWSNDLSPKTGKEVKAWPYRENYDTIIDPETGTKYLTVEPEEFLKKEHQATIDCMSASQLTDWLKGKLKNVIDSVTLKNVLNKIKESEEAEQEDDLSKKRFARIRKNIELLQITWSELQALRSVSGFQTVINTSIQEQLDNVLSSERAQLEAKRKQFQQEFSQDEQKVKQQKKDLEKEIQKLRDSFENLQKKCIAEKENVIAQEKSLKEISEKRTELIESIKLQANIIGGASTTLPSWNYPLEHIVRDPDAEAVCAGNKDSFCDRVNESLELQTGFMRRALTSLRQHDILKTTDIRTGVFLANALGNSAYQLCQPSPQWISFKDFWDESLSVIWASAHKNTDIWHFLLIENFNIALPECWGMPLWNIVSGKTTILPCAVEPTYPRNLRIITSFAPTTSEDNSHIGLQTGIGSNWHELNPNKPWDDNNCWEKFIDDRDAGLVVNEEFFYPVS